MYTTYGNYGTNTVNGAGLALFGGLFIVYMLICLAITVVTIIGMWKVFTKAGEEGWKSIIPVYNIITLCKIIGVSPWWILIIFGASILSLIPILGILIGLAEMVAAVYFGILVAKRKLKLFMESEDNRVRADLNLRENMRSELAKLQYRLADQTARLDEYNDLVPSGYRTQRHMKQVENLLLTNKAVSFEEAISLIEGQERT